jgi:hypothetical protein
MTDQTSIFDGIAPEDPLVAVIWFSCLKWAIGQQNIVDEFRAETGNTWTPGKTGLDQMIDRSSGAEADFMRQFAEWFDKAIWGPMEEDE